MGPQPSSSPRIVFGPFEYEPASGDLRKHGTRIRLQGKPLLILSILLERPNEVVSRDELQGRLWQGTTFVDFEQGLNAAVNKVRQALGDSADHARYVQTVSGRGYRFIAPVQRTPSKTVLELAAPAQIRTRGERPVGRWVWPVVAGTFAVLAVVAIGALLRRTTDTLPVSRWTAILSESRPESGYGVVISRDGTRLAYAEHSGPSSRIWVRMLDQPDGRPVPGTEGGLRPVFSPDGQWLAYVGGTRGALKKIPILGGIPVTLCEGAYFNGATWDDDNRIVFVGSQGLRRVSAAGGPCENLTTADPKSGEGHRWPQILPGGQVVLFTAGTVLDFENTARVVALDLRTGRYRNLVNGAMVGRYVPAGFLVYVRRGILFAAPFDLEGLVVTGPEKRLIDGLDYRPNGGFADYAFSNSGLLIYPAAARAINSHLVWMSRTGTFQAPAPAREYRHIRISPDAQLAAVDFSFSPSAGHTGIWIVDLARGASIRLPAPGFTTNPVWTPDGKRVAFSSQSNGGNSGIFWTAADGSGKPELLLATEEAAYPTSWTPDGGTLLFHMGSPGSIWALAVNGARKTRQMFEASGFSETQPLVSPDGRWIAYSSNESGENRIYVRPFAGPGGKAPVSTGPGEQPRWSRDGRCLFYRDPQENRLMAVDIQPTAPFRPAQPSGLFPLGNVPWDAEPEGKRFLAVQVAENADRASELHVVVNWFDELLRKDLQGAN